MGLLHRGRLPAKWLRVWLAALACCAVWQAGPLLVAQPLVELDAGPLATGNLVNWPNSGTLGGSFTREFDPPQVAVVAGVKAVTLDGDRDWLVGPAAPAGLTGNGSRTVLAWVFNPAIATEETVIAWGRRGAGEGTNASFIHGTHVSYGAIGQWGERSDVGWNGAQEQGIWTCVAYRYDGANGTSAVFTNGVLSNSEANGPISTHAATDQGTPLRMIVGCQNSYVGTRDNGQVPASLSIARLRVHDRALSETEIVAFYNQGAAVFGRPPLLIGGFATSSHRLLAGQSAVLSWSVADGAAVAIVPGVAVPAGATSVEVTPEATTVFTMTAMLPGGLRETRSLTVVVDPGAPVAIPQELSTAAGVALDITLTARDPNSAPEHLAWTVSSQPLHGTVTVGPGPHVRYTPPPGFGGHDEFWVKASDGVSESEPVRVRIAVMKPPAPPSLVSSSVGQIRSDVVAGGFIAYLRAGDINFLESHSFALVPGVGDGDHSWFVISGNQLLAARDMAAAAGLSLSLRVRVTDSGGLSTEQVLVFQVVPATAPTVVIHEIHYDPADNLPHEFVELHNPSGVAVDVSGWSFTAGIDYLFPAGSWIAPGGYLVLAANSTAFAAQYGRAAAGQFAGRLSGDGERLDLRDSAGVLVDSVDYGTTFPWPVSANGGGPSIELIHPSLDNDLGGSWRASVSAAAYGEMVLIPRADSGWRWRPGSSEPSLPPDAWRARGYVPDASWSGLVQAPVGYGIIDGLPLNTRIAGMEGQYTTFFARREFVILPGEIPNSLLLRYSPDDGILVWINGRLVAQRNMATTAPDLATRAAAVATEGLWYDEVISNAATFLVEGANVVAVQVFNQTRSSSDAGFDLELVRPAASQSHANTPGRMNSVRSATAPPQVRQVRHQPKQPRSSQKPVITAKVTDPQGVAGVRLFYQIVAPGAFVPAAFPRTVAEVMADPAGARPANPAFEDPANWAEVAMRDDGISGDETAADGVFSVIIPEQPHRTLVRYRIRVEDMQGAAVRVPYADDESLNFAYFVYDGLPGYQAVQASVGAGGVGTLWESDALGALPVYHWLIRNEDMMSLQAYEWHQQFTNTGTDVELAARRAEEWEGAFVYDGVVYDHVRTRLRGGNSRYGDFGGRFPRGKRHYKFHFNRGYWLQARDQKGAAYPRRWQKLALNRMFGTAGGNGWGLPEEIGATLWRAFGVPAPRTHWAHFRVIDGAAEAPDQYRGDFWGLTQAVEEYDGSYLDARGMAKGNLYKMSDWIWDAERQRRYQSPDMVRDGSEFNNIRDNLHGGQNAEWLQRHVNYDRWYRYSAVAEAIRHYDVFPFTDPERHSLKNLAWYFEPVGTDPARGVCTFLPYDWDASFGPSFNNGWDHANNALYGWDQSDATQNGMPYLDKPTMKIAHRNVLREFRDLVWQPDQVNGLIDDRAAVIRDFSLADQDRWRDAPASEGTARDDSLAFKVQDMKNFCFIGWSGDAGPPVGAGGRAAFLDTLADGPDAGLLPQTPVISYTGAPGYPVNGLVFSSSPFADPQGAGTFARMAWRIGRIEDPAAPGHDPAEDFILEAAPIWESGELSSPQWSVSVPPGALRTGCSYRARVRMMDQSGRWSHWSAPWQFTTTAPGGLADLRDNLMVTEVMYNPAGPALPGGSKEDFEFIELQNVSRTLTLDLTGMRFSVGVLFDFGSSAITRLRPGERLLVVKNIGAFETRYGSGLPVAGAWDGTKNLSNGGERLVLSHEADGVVRDFSYDDAVPWPTAADGGGPSLTLIDPPARPDHWQAASWSASRLSFGSPGLEDSRFAVWLHGRGGEAAGEAVPGMSFALMYALGGDLVASPVDALPRSGWMTGGDGRRYLTLDFRTRNDAPELSYVVEVSDDLRTWQSGALHTEVLGVPLDNGDGTHMVRVRCLEPAAAGLRRFVRLRTVIGP